MNPDHGQPGPEGGLELPQLRKYMQAVDSARGPEIEQHQFSTQLPDRQWRGVEPIETGRKLRCAHATGVVRRLHLGSGFRDDQLATAHHCQISDLTICDMHIACLLESLPLTILGQFDEVPKPYPFEYRLDPRLHHHQI